MRPQSIRRFELFYLLSAAAWLIAGLVGFNAAIELIAMQSPEVGTIAPVLIGGMMVIYLIIWVLLWFFAARKGADVARWIIVILFGLSVLSFIYSLATGAFQFNLVGIITLLEYIFGLIAVVMLFQRDSAAWFTGGDEAKADEPVGFE